MKKCLCESNTQQDNATGATTPNTNRSKNLLPFVHNIGITVEINIASNTNNVIISIVLNVVVKALAVMMSLPILVSLPEMKFNTLKADLNKNGVTEVTPATKDQRFMIVVNSIGRIFLLAPDNIRLMHSIIVSTTTIPTATPLNPKLIVVNHSLSNRNKGVCRISPVHNSYIQANKSADIFATFVGIVLMMVTNSPNQFIISCTGVGNALDTPPFTIADRIPVLFSRTDDVSTVSAYAVSPIVVKVNVEMTAAGIVEIFRIFRSLDLRSLNF